MGRGTRLPGPHTAVLGSALQAQAAGRNHIRAVATYWADSSPIQRARTRLHRAGPMGHEKHALMPDHDDIPRRRRALILDVTQAAAEVSRVTREAYDLNLPVEPGVRDGRHALVRWAALLEDVIP